MTASKLLSMCLLVSSNAFGKLNAAKQTEVLTGASGKPIVFVDNFDTITNAKTIVSKLMAGVDVSMELEFNGIELTEAELESLTAVKPILAKIEALKPAYPWVETLDAEKERLIASLQLDDTHVGRSNGYKITVKQALVIWNRASRYWAGKSNKPNTTEGNYSGHSYKTVDITKENVYIGCQTIRREEVEAVAKHYGWEPNVN